MPNNVRSTLSGGRLAALRWLCLAYALWNVLLQLLAPQADSYLPFIGGALFETVFWLSACKLAAEARAGRTPRLLDTLRLLREKSAPRNLIVVLATLLPLWALSFSTLAENHGAPALLVYALQALALLGMLNWFFPYVALAEPQAPARETWKSIWRCLRADFGEILSLRLRMLLKFLMPLVLFCALLLALDRQGMLGNVLPEPRNLLAYIYAAFVCVAGPYFLQTEAGCAEKVLRESRRVKRAKR